MVSTITRCMTEIVFKPNKFLSLVILLYLAPPMFRPFCAYSWWLVMKSGFVFTEKNTAQPFSPLMKWYNFIILLNSVPPFDEKIATFQWKKNDYTTIPRMTIARLTKCRPDFHKLTIQRLVFSTKKGLIFFPTNPHRLCTKTALLPLTVLRK